MAIERKIVEALHNAPQGSIQEAHARSLLSYLEAVKAAGFVDNPDDEAREAPREPIMFTEEARSNLENLGAKIYTPTGQSISTLREAGRKFYSGWHKKYPRFEELPSSPIQVAIWPTPEEFFLEESNRKAREEQELMIADFSKELSEKVLGVQSVLCEAPDLIEVVFQHLIETGEVLFGEDYGYANARTNTRLQNKDIIVGAHGRQRGLTVSTATTKPRERLYVVKFVVPAQV